MSCQQDAAHGKLVSMERGSTAVKEQQTTVIPIGRDEGKTITAQQETKTEEGGYETTELQPVTQSGVEESKSTTPGQKIEETTLTGEPLIQQESTNIPVEQTTPESIQSTNVINEGSSIPVEVTTIQISEQPAAVESTQATQGRRLSICFFKRTCF